MGQQVAHLYNRDQGVAWVGSKATLVCNREGYELIPEKNREGELLPTVPSLSGSSRMVVLRPMRRIGVSVY